AGFDPRLPRVVQRVLARSREEAVHAVGERPRLLDRVLVARVDEGRIVRDDRSLQGRRVGGIGLRGEQQDTGRGQQSTHTSEDANNPLLKTCIECVNRLCPTVQSHRRHTTLTGESRCRHLAVTGRAYLPHPGSASGAGLRGLSLPLEVTWTGSRSLARPPP